MKTQTPGSGQMAGRRHVIVGGGTAGINAIRTLRQLGCDDPVALVSLERPYSRMVLPYYLERRISETHVATVSAQQLDDWNVEQHLGVRVTGLDPQAGMLQMAGREPIAFDDLLIATGSSAVRAPIPGADLPGVHSFWTLKDARGVHTTIRPDSHVVLVGAGFISFTILDAILKRAGKLTIVEVADRILPRMVDAAGAALVADWLQSRGVDIRTAARLAEIKADPENPGPAGNGLRLNFESGEPLVADLVLMATGIRPNLGWLEDSGVILNQGILVDEHLRSNFPHIYAAGDVAEAKNRISGQAEVHAIEPTAMEHGRVVGANMAGQDIAYSGSLLMNIVGVAGLDLASFGSWDDDGAEVLLGEAPDRQAYRKYLLRDGRMVGAILIEPAGITWSENDLGMLKGIVQSGTNLGPWVDYLRRHPFEIKKPFLALYTTQRLLPETLLGQPNPAPPRIA